MNVRTAFLLALCLFTGIPLASAQESEDPLATYEGLSKAIAENMPGLIIIDLRDRKDYVAGHIPKAISIPLNSLYYNPPTKDLKATIVIYDRFGNLCLRAFNILEGMGFKRIVTFGRIANWKAERVK